MSGYTVSTLPLSDLLGRKVEDAEGRDLGRVWDVETALEGDRLRVVALVVGASSMLGRFGWTKHAGGRIVPWESVSALDPRVKLRARGA